MNNTEMLVPLIAGFILDTMLGDPYWLPHPIRLFGKMISKGENILNKGKLRQLKGSMLSIVLIGFTFLVLKYGIDWLSEYKTGYWIFSSVLVFYGLANRSLIVESLKVIRELDKNGVSAARKQLSMIVGRDTTQLDAQQIRTAVLETLAENLSDGVIAPLFYYVIGGIPAMFAYKMANTLDSMIGYKNERFKEFGWFAARFDDALNFLPARITAFLMVLITFSGRGFRFILKYGKKHSSANAGYPEAALAGILNCRFGGPNIYHGKLVDKPFIGNNPRILSDKDVYKSCRINFCVAFLFLLIVISIMAVEW